MKCVGEQIAALPIRRNKKGGLEVLMVTSRGTGRWVMPKGWEMNDRKPWAAAEIEALEEAGARGFVSRQKIGTYRYDKVLEDGRALPCTVRVYPMMVEELLRDWKERKERKRRWFSMKAAAKRVDEADLAALLMALHRKPLQDAAIRALLKAS